ncbi:type II toxin-antitoxin system RelE/ParE family toxin [Methylomusa anaerophila]|uniref:Plasmid stabilisation system protein n=2 Tax=Methylomusa anaerophila TaxID=1930071 RepID=A0A348AGK0_9FIRM|nr:type II toxin-antitoxin system RelE/ParE family toxin [Methylomusa anaerophila]BBB90198.1 plasmid stabilisation system protein [Methylomusa anaerophila]
MVRYKLLIRKGALRQLESIVDYIAQDRPQVAQLQADKILDTIQLLDEFPFMGPITRDPKLAKKNYRVLPVEEYLVLYLINEDEDTVIVERILSAKQYSYYL